MGCWLSFPPSQVIVNIHRGLGANELILRVMYRVAIP